MEGKQAYVFAAGTAATVCFNEAEAIEKFTRMLREAKDRQVLFDLRVREKPADLVAEVFGLQLPQDPEQLPQQPDKKEKKAAPGKDHPWRQPLKKKMAAGAKVVKKGRRVGSKKQTILDVLAGINKESSISADLVCQKTQLPKATVAPILSELAKTGSIGKVNDKPLRFYGVAKPDTKNHGTGTAAGAGQVKCAARNGKMIERDQCVPNSNLQACIGCPEYKA